MATFRFHYNGQRFELEYSIDPGQPNPVILEDVRGVNGTDPNAVPDDITENYRAELERDLFEPDNTPAD